MTVLPRTRRLLQQTLWLVLLEISVGALRAQTEAEARADPQLWPREALLLTAGRTMPVLKIEGDMVTLDFNGSPVTVPLASTDIRQRLRTARSVSPTPTSALPAPSAPAQKESPSLSSTETVAPAKPTPPVQNAAPYATPNARLSAPGPAVIPPLSMPANKAPSRVDSVLGHSAAFEAWSKAAHPPVPRPLEPRGWNQLVNRVINPRGIGALAVRPNQWQHGESENFILHYRNLADASRVAEEIEYHLWFVARALGAEPKSYASKSHVFVFENDADWRAFRDRAGFPPWSNSVAFGDELYLNVRDTRTGQFDSGLLAHETTHAVVARLYGASLQWPSWLGEGFAEVMKEISVSSRGGMIEPRPEQKRPPLADLDFDALLRKPLAKDDLVEVMRFYRNSERLVRFLFTAHDPELFARFVDAVLFHGDIRRAVVDAFRYPDFPSFEAAWEKWKAAQKG